MFNTTTDTIVVFVIICTTLIALLAGFITAVVYKYQQHQNAYQQDIERLKIAHANEMLQSQLEIQEQTFENISREIHDNIGQKLTLAKLHLNTLDTKNISSSCSQLHDSISIIGEAINDLSDISRSMSSEIILNNGFIKALEFEVAQLNKPGLYKIEMSVQGEPVFFESKKELVLFRIVQEALNNIVKHAMASAIVICLNYSDQALLLTITDNGKGFANSAVFFAGTGISNMQRRAKMLAGNLKIESEPGMGTGINIEIPLYENRESV